MADTNEQSSIQLGGFDASYMKNQALGLVWVRSEAAHAWVASFDGFRVGKAQTLNGANSSWAENYFNNAYLDTVSPFITINTNDFERLIPLLLSPEAQEDPATSIYYGSCDPSLY